MRHLAPNVVELTNLFNQVSNWVAHSIVSETKLRDRTNLFHRHVVIAKKLQELKNFHLVMAYISAFNGASISRLKWTQSKLPKSAKQVTVPPQHFITSADAHRTGGANSNRRVLSQLTNCNIQYCSSLHSIHRSVSDRSHIYRYVFSCRQVLLSDFSQRKVTQIWWTTLSILKYDSVISCAKLV